MIIRIKASDYELGDQIQVSFSHYIQEWFYHSSFEQLALEESAKNNCEHTSGPMAQWVRHLPGYESGYSRFESWRDRLD